ncbi:MAG: galactose mutarotase [Bacteroidales bacterium]|nr:galactose mutarotase [Bacteroidales bacterium]
MIDPEEIRLFSIVNADGSEVILSNLGAGIVSIVVPDREGRMADVVLGYANPADYEADGPCMGKVPGRFANRIAAGHFALGGKEYNLSINNGPNHLHGGPGAETYANRIWNAEQLPDGVRFTLDSTDGDAGYPGALHAEALYTWSDDHRLTLKLTATAGAETVVNLTNHAYFNLKGEEAGDVTGHVLKLNASRYLPTDSTLIPVGEPAPVAGTPMDFTVAKPIGRDLKADFPALNYGKGYDNCFVVDGWKKGVVKPVAELSEESTGRRLTVLTDAPGIQVYTGNWLAGCPVSKSGKKYEDYDGVALECQAFPDSPNRPDFPFETLVPGATYVNTIVFQFE